MGGTRTVGWFWFLGTLVPVIGLVQVGSQAMADRYMYLPLIGLALAVAWEIPALAARWIPDPRRRRALLAAAACVCIAALGTATSRQLRHWRDSEALMRHALAVTQGNQIAHAHLGIALLERGEVSAAIAHWRESTRIAPRFLEVVNNLAWLLATTPDASQRDPAQAIELAERALRLAPAAAAVLDTLAAAYASGGRFADATSAAERARARALQAGDAPLAADIERRLALYRRGIPYVERHGGGASRSRESNPTPNRVTSRRRRRSPKRRRGAQVAPGGYWARNFEPSHGPECRSLTCRVRSALTGADQ